MNLVLHGNCSERGLFIGNSIRSRAFASSHLLVPALLLLTVPAFSQTAISPPNIILNKPPSVSSSSLGSGSSPIRVVRPDVIRHPDALSILRQAVNALGGESSVRIHTCTDAHGTFTSGDKTTQTTGAFRWRTSGSEVRYERSQTGDSSSEVLVSGHGKPEVSINGIVHKPKTAVLEYPPHLPAHVFAIFLDSPQTSIQFVDTESFQMRTVYRIRLSNSSDPAMLPTPAQDWLIDSSAFIPVGVISSISLATRRPSYVTQTITLDDYRPTDGMLLPFSVHYTTDGFPDMTYSISSVDISHSLEDGLFNLTESAKQ